MVAEAAGSEPAELGTVTVPGDAEPVHDSTLEIGNGPKLAARGRGLGTEEVSWRVVLEMGAEHPSLLGSEFGAIAADAPSDETDQTGTSIHAASVHQTGATAAGTIDHLRYRVARAI